ncbi:BamA/TamA family outer membrane protein [Flavobacterium sp. MAH-1]|uniref:BamA/TamA family outer membrane protein n=1 Tax=Flavobacterium agri TaxID=2743471 RepID=A0A7Y9C8N0_9FLAO|nr:BamA/TamA family outer membrane protein [Flavobacterium agri]NUY82548.1 BamA/TamA family outer membrane protein [Flavobacterium agri]NYA72572.1 BamA/TamA family outer membrane protein [Flavobacterium agri]
MRSLPAKIALFVLCGLLLSGCNSTKRVPKSKKLLTKNEFVVNDKKQNTEELENLMYQKPNSSLLGYRLRLNLYNLANPNPDSTYKAKFIKNPKKYERLAKILSKKQVNRLGKSFYYFGIHQMLKRIGEPPAIIDTNNIRKSRLRLKGHYFNQGYFNAKILSRIDSVADKKARVTYTIKTGTPYFLDSLSQRISTPVLDSMFQATKDKSALTPGKQFNGLDFDAEKARLTSLYRNNGIYHFQANYIKFDIDTVDTNHKANSKMIIDDYSYRENDTTKTMPFKQYKISEVNIYTDATGSKIKPPIKDSVTYKGFNLYASDRLKYRPKAITDAVFINKGNLFSDIRTTVTSRYLSNLRVFNYPSIQYEVDPRDTIGNSLIANIYLVPRKKFSFGYSLDVTHSNIQDFGIQGTTSVTIRNVFNGAETLEIAARGNIGSSKDLANPNDTFFNVSEYGADMKLSFPRIVFPLNTEKIIPKNMIPVTTISLGYAKQRNIGLDKENFTGAFSYTWTPKRFYSSRLDLFNIQYVKNLNPQNYFNVYSSSYSALNNIAKEYLDPSNPTYFNENGNLAIDSGTNQFIADVVDNGSVAVSPADLRTVRSIDERRDRLTENNLIFASSYSYSKTTKTDLQDNTFYTFRTKIESAGNFLSLVARLSKQLKNQNGNNTIFDIEYSQYLKGEFEYIKHWDLTRKKVLAMRAFAGIAIPYGNSESVPFSRSYFAGGSNDNRGWQSYSLGPGSSGGINDFNEANMKLAYSAEFRFNLFGDLHSAVFADVGNIWNVLDNTEDERYKFSGLKSLEDIAVGSGFGLRYDFNFFVVRLDVGFKTYDPAINEGSRWLRNYNFAHSVLNIGINYPF